MKRIAITVCALALAASTAFAEKGDTWIGVQGGISSPTGDIGKTYKLGYDGSIYGTYGVTKDFGLGLEAGYHAFKAKDDFNTTINNDLGVTTADAKFSMIPITVIGTYAIPMSSPKSMPYVKLGVGMYLMKAKIDGIPTPVDTSMTKFGGNVQLGYNYEISPMYTIGLNVAYHMVFAGDAIKNDSGNNVNPSFFTAGINLTWGRKATK